MAQTYTENCFAVGNAGLTDLQNMEDNFHALKTMFSGSSAPSNTTSGMPWFDTAKKILKLRNSTNGAWLGVHYSSTEARWWVYANAAGDGWVVDSSVTDRVVAIKGGTQAYNASGGTGAGTWTISGTTLAADGTDHIHTVANHDHTFGTVEVVTGSTDDITTPVFNSYTTSGGHNTGGRSSVHYHAVSHDGTWRPAASIGTLQYLDM